MAVDFSKTEHTRTSEYLILPQDLKVIPDLNGRVDQPDLEPLIESMVELGQLQPILIRNQDGQAIVIVGHGRWQAGCEINKRKLTPVPFKLRCVYLKSNEQDGFLANIAENRVRNATTALDDAHNIARLERWGQTTEQIAKLYQETPAWVRSRSKLITLEPEAKAAVKAGRLKPTAAAQIAKLSAEQQREAVKGAGKIKGKTAKPKPAGDPGGKNAESKLKTITKLVQDAFDESEPKSDLRKLCEKIKDVLELPF